MKNDEKKIYTRAEAINHVAKHPLGLRDLSDEFRDDEEIVSIAVSSYGYALQFASKRLRSNKDIVKKAVLREPRSLACACLELRDAPDMREFAYRIAGRPFIVDPIAMEVFSVLDNKMIAATVKTEIVRVPIYRDNILIEYRERKEIVRDKNGEVVFDEEKMYQNKFYQRFKKFYNGTATATDIQEYEQILRKMKNRYLSKKELLDLEESYII